MDDYRIVWSAPIHEHRVHGVDWYWAVGIITTALAVAFFIIGNIPLSLILLLGVGTLLLYAWRGPSIVEYEISERGIRAGTTLYKWESLDSFWILERERATAPYVSSKLFLTSKKTFMLHIMILLDNAPIAEIRAAMESMLPAVPQNESLPERLMRKLGF